MGNGTVKTDRRVIKTKRAIHRAMVRLMTEKDINEITVKDIADAAEINRKTFYNYYSGVYQLLDEIENGVVDYFAKLLETTDFEQALADPSVLFDKLYETIRENLAFVSALFSAGSNSSLSGKVQSKLIEMTRDAAVQHFQTDPEKTEIIVRFIFAGEIAAYQAWYRNGRKVPVKELSLTIETLCTKGLDGLLGE